MDANVRNIGRRVGHIAARAVGSQTMTGQKSRSYAPEHGSIIQDYSGPGVNGGGNLLKNAGSVYHGATGAVGDVMSASRHMGQLAVDPIGGAKGLVGDAISGAKHGLQLVKGALPFLPI
jgi:hypothetical protein